MIKCSYIVLLHNDQKNVHKLVSSLRRLKGNFKREFIFVDDGSEDDTLTELKSAIVNLPRSTILAQEHQGPAICINKAASLIDGDFIQFVEGHEVVHPDSTIVLLQGIGEFEAGVAIGAVSGEDYKGGDIEGDITLYENPIAEIIKDDNPAFSRLGKSGSLIRRDLLEKIGQADVSVYLQNVSLALRAAKYANFAITEGVVTYIKPKQICKPSFTAHNNLKAIHNFLSNHKKLCEKLVPELLKALAKNAIDGKSRMKYKLLCMAAKYLKTVPFEKVVEYYRLEADKLF